MKSKKYVALDGMRGIAAIFVLTRHTPNFWGTLNSQSNHSYLAVDLFFMLSGFVLSEAYGMKMRNGSLSGGQFMWLRFVRLYPLYFLAAVLSFAVGEAHFWRSAVVGLIGSHQLILTLLLSLLFLPSRIPQEVNLFPLNVSFWSLFYEMATNALYAFVHRWLTHLVLSALVLVSMLGLVGLTIYNGGIDMGFSWGNRSLAIGAFRAMFGFFGGLLLHRVFQARLLHRWVRPGAWAALFAVATVLLLPTFGGTTWAFDLLSATLVFPLCIYAAAHAQTRRATRVFHVLGLASYPLYLLHLPLSVLFAAYLPVALANSGAVQGLLFVSVLIVLSLLVDRFYDRPLRRFILSCTLDRWGSSRVRHV